MNNPDKRRTKKDNEDGDIEKRTRTEDAVEDDGTPVLDEKDLEENHISVEEADQIEWEDPDEDSDI